MTRIRQLLALLTAVALLAPTGLAAQRVPSLLLRVHDGGAPASGIEIALYRGGERRLLGTTGPSGLAVVEFGRAPLQEGARLSVFSVICPNRGEIALTRSLNSVPPAAEGCATNHLGAAVWYKTERLDVELGEAPRMSGQTAESVVRIRSGWRAQADFSVAFLFGEEISNTGTGLGGDFVVGYDAPGGLGIGAGFALHRHGLEGLDEGLWRYSAFVEPRYTIMRPDWRTQPYVLLRAGREWLDADQGSGLATEKGWNFGVGTGVNLLLFGHVGADLGARISRLSVNVNGFDNSDRKGWLLSLAAGLRL